MGNPQPAHDYRETLLKELEARKSRNARYSIRAFARFLGVSHATLLAAMNKQAHLRSANLMKLAERLGWSSDLVNDALAEIKNMRKADAMLGRMESSGDSPEFFGEWHCLATRDLCFFFDVPNDPSWLAKKLGISVEKAQLSIETLLQSGACRLEGGMVRALRPAGHFSLDQQETRDWGDLANHTVRGVESSRALTGENNPKLMLNLPMDPSMIGKFYRAIHSFGRSVRRQAEKMPTERRLRRLYMLQVQFVPVSDFLEPEETIQTGPQSCA